MTTKMPKLPLHKLKIAVDLYLSELQSNPKVKPEAVYGARHELLAFIGYNEASQFKEQKHDQR